jgi:hypothetical protein
MCCSRQHYPKKVGLHQNSASHFHIILPWSNSIGICVCKAGKHVALVTWRCFAPRRLERQKITFSDTSEKYKAIELIAIGVAEGGELHEAWLDNLLLEARFDYSLERVFRGKSEWKLLPPENALSYAEWLANQLKAEHDRREEEGG